MAQLLDDVIVRLRGEADELRRRGIRHLAVFGSVARGDARPDSDVDIAIEIEPGARFSLITMEGTRRHLEGILGRPVDIGTKGSLKARVRETFDHDNVEVF